MKAFEANFDGLVGPTHNYAGLSYGNIASSKNQSTPANPKLAAKQGLAKMKALHDLGLIQGVLPPQERPDLETLRHLGFTGNDQQVLSKTAKQAPKILAACCSASSMWTANAATVSASADTADSKVHFTAANLASKFHRAIEPATTEKVLKKIFPDGNHFAHHRPLPGITQFGDEGAANHTRFCEEYGSPGINFFVYGCSNFNNSGSAVKPKLFPARQTLEASEAITRKHLLNERQVIFAQQNPDAIDQGVFHNDVIAVGNRNLLFCHEKAFLNQQKVYQALQQAYPGNNLTVIEVPDNAISIKEAVKSYLFNSQLITVSGRTILIAPSECREITNVSNYLDELLATNKSISEIKSFDLRQSMKNGGGPACLRLRVVLTENELNAVNPNCLLNDHLFKRLSNWIDKHYRDKLTEQDLADPLLLEESRVALDELTNILQLGSLYPFQQ